MKVWISKYALTQGIYEAEVERSTSAPSMVVQKQATTYAIAYHGEGKEWHHTEQEAKDKANQMVAAKIESLEKQLRKLRGTKF